MSYDSTSMERQGSFQVAVFERTVQSRTSCHRYQKAIALNTIVFPCVASAPYPAERYRTVDF